MAYIGRGINSGDAVSDHLTGSGATVYTLTYDTTTDGVVLSLDGVVQRNGTDFTILGTQLTFTSAVASPIAIQIIYTGLTLAIGTPGTGTVGVSQLSSTGTASSSTYLRGDNSWATIPATADEITKSASDPTASTNPAGGVGTLFLNTTSGEMYSCTDATAGSNVWTNIGDGTGVLPLTYMSATGGTITTDGSYKVHTFNASGTFTPTIGTVSTVGNTVEYLVIAGGAGGGNENYSSGIGGGGGAGGYLTATAFAVTDTGLTVTVGGGGAGQATNGLGVNGTNSVFSSITATGGGAGGNVVGAAGGSGGGNGNNSGAGGAASPAGQGNAGGSYTAGQFAGGGGGAGGAGNAGASASPGSEGGVGLASSITGTSVFRAGGGGGGTASKVAPGGNGGGGQGGDYKPPAGATQSGFPGTANTGGGAGGGTNEGGSGGTGGSGVVIIRYQFQA